MKSGKRAVTHYTVSERLTGAAKVEIRLETGRTHQIRVHLSDAGHPLVGDRLYGRKQAIAFARPALHARRLAFRHPITGESIDLLAPMPEDLLTLIADLGVPSSH